MKTLLNIIEFYGNVNTERIYVKLKTSDIFTLSLMFAGPVSTRSYNPLLLRVRTPTLKSKYPNFVL